MNLTGSRATFIANISAAVIACAVLIEVAIIENARWGHVLASDPFLCFFPVLVMLVVRSEPFSFAFLLIYLGVLLRLSFTVQGILAGTYKFRKADDPLFILVLFTMVTVVCLAAYLVTALLRSIATALSKR